MEFRTELLVSIKIILLIVLIIKNHRLVTCEQQKSISHGSGGYNSEIRVSAWSGSGETLIWLKLLDFCILTWQKEGKRVLWGLLYKDPNLIHEGSILMTILPPKFATSLYYHIQGDIFNTQIGGARWYTNIHSITNM